MTYGVRLVNDLDQINIDDNNPIYYVVQEGVYTQTVKYPNSIVFDENYRNTIQTPLVFVKPNTGGGQLCMLLKYFGSAGNWQGCEWHTTTVPGAAPGVVGGRYKVVVPFMPKSTGWGMHVMDSAGQIVFDSGYKPAIFTGGSQYWTYYAWNPNPPGGGGSGVNSWQSVPGMPADTYFCITGLMEDWDGRNTMIGDLWGNRQYLYVVQWRSYQNKGVYPSPLLMIK
ncbi:hypothetical protein [Pseudomonas aeruginosa]|uniref:hypothetical protein n=1 Tax=Pseudomonas aeruginosa TaxID=287 RepID=UPI0018C322DB|nr:hypothetical protein [Pseudomonas aeruginosa]